MSSELFQDKLTEEQLKEIKRRARISEQSATKQIFMGLFRRRSYYNEIAGEMCFYTLCSVLLKNNIIELSAGRFLRLHTHFIFLQDSGTGKDQAINLLTEVIDAYNAEAKSRNNKGLKSYPIISYCNMSGTESTESLLDYFAYNEKKKQHDYNNVIRGMFSKYDLLISRECSYYLTESRFERQTKSELLLSALEGQPLARSLKSWEGNKTITQSDFVFIGLTRPFDAGKMKTAIINMGLQQRCLNFCREVSIGLRFNMMRRASSNVFKSDTKGYMSSPFKPDLTHFVNKLFDIYDHSLTCIPMPDNLRSMNSFLSDSINYFFRDIHNEVLSQEHRLILNSFISRFRDIIVRLAYINAYARLSKVVELMDIEIAVDLVKKEYESLKVWVESNIFESERVVNTRKKMLSLARRYFTGPEIRIKKVKFRDVVMNNLSCGQSYAYKWINFLTSGKNSLLKVERDVLTLRGAEK